MKKTLFLLVGLLVSLASVAQTVNVGVVYETIRAVYPGNPDAFTITISPADSAKVVTVKSYYVTGGIASPSVQPVVTRLSGIKYTVRVANVSLLPVQARLKLSLNGVVKQVWRYDVSESNTIKTAPDNLTIVNNIVTDSFLELKGIPAYLSKSAIDGKADLSALASKLDVVLSTSTSATTAARTGSSKMIIEIIAGSTTVYIYSPTATPTLQKILTYN